MYVWLGLTFKSGVFVDCTWVKNRMDDGVFWLNLYTMLSRATALQNLLLWNAPTTKEDNAAAAVPLIYFFTYSCKHVFFSVCVCLYACRTGRPCRRRRRSSKR